MASVIFGLGSGRCGTLSLAQVLGLSHEALLLPWEKDLDRFDQAWEKVAGTGGDVSMTWLRYLPEILERDPAARFVCLRRDRDETVRSWGGQMLGRQRFAIYCLYRDRHGAIRCPSIFPDYGDCSHAEGAARLWQDYYAEAEAWQERMPERFRIFDSPKVLNDPKAQRAMLRFVGRPRAPLKLGIRRHRFEGRNPREAEAKRLLATLHGWMTDLAAQALRGRRDLPGKLELAEELARSPERLEQLRRLLVLKGMKPSVAATFGPADLAVDLRVGDSSMI